MHSRRVFPGRPFCTKAYAPENLFNRPPPKVVQYFLIDPVIPNDKKIWTSSDTNEYVSTKKFKNLSCIVPVANVFSGGPFGMSADKPENSLHRPPSKMFQYFVIFFL